MAAGMLDAELLAIARRAVALDSSTPLQKAVSDEIVRRNIPHHAEFQLN